MNYQNEEYIQYSKKKKNKETRSIAWYLTTHITLYIVLIFFLIFFAWYTYFSVTHRYYLVTGSSMQPTLNSGILSEDESEDAVYVNIYGNIDFGDIVVINASNNSDDIIKRVLATGGDYVTIARSGNSYYIYRIAKENVVLDENGIMTGSLIEDVNARLQENERGGFSYNIDYISWGAEPGIPQGGITYEAQFYNQFIADADEEDLFTSSNGLIYVKVPDNYVFCLGDNRANSRDSRYYGYFSLDEIVGDVEIIVYDYSFGNRVLQVISFYYRQVEEFFAR